MRLTRADWIRLLLLWLGGIDLRLTMLAVPPLVPLIHRDLHLDEKGIGALVSLPVLLLAVAAVPGSLLIAKSGLREARIARSANHRVGVHRTVRRDARLRAQHAGFVRDDVSHGRRRGVCPARL